MKIMLILNCPGVVDQKDGEILAARFADVLIDHPVNDEAVIHTITSMVPKQKGE